ncbi:MAG: hypothetical protein H6739_31565 [Alphaproteobacteria bacterium]|nr:hypothetical protein [Alphaproteobacteria bacterium]
MLLLLLACGAAPTVHIEGDPARPEVRVTAAGDLDPGALRVRRLDADGPLAGTITREGDALVFRPAFTLDPGARFVAQVELPTGGALEQSWTVPGGTPTPPPEVVSVRPALDALPANQLKLYLTFSAPMRSDRDVVGGVRLVEETSGHDDPLAWYREELWDRDRQRLTLVFHPGRVKTDIPFAEGLGPVLMEGHRYRVEATKALQGADGQPLAAPWTWRFTVGPADHTRPRPEDWTLDAPAAGSRDPLVLHFDEPVEPVLTETAFRVEADGATVPVVWAVSADSLRIEGVPAQPWAAAPHRLLREGRIEDLAGNTPERRFDGPADEVRRQDAAQAAWDFAPGSPPEG